MGLAVLVPVDSSVAGDWTKVVAVLCRCCAGRILLGGVPGHPCERLAGTYGCGKLVVDAGPGHSRALGSSLIHVVDAVRRSDSFTGSSRTLPWSGGDFDVGYRVDVTVALHCCGRLGVDAAVSVQHEAAAGGCFSPLFRHQLSVIVPLLPRRFSLATATAEVTGSGARGCASTVL